MWYVAFSGSGWVRIVMFGWDGSDEPEGREEGREKVMEKLGLEAMSWKGPNPVTRILVSVGVVVSILVGGEGCGGREGI